MLLLLHNRTIAQYKVIESLWSEQGKIKFILCEWLRWNKAQTKVQKMYDKTKLNDPNKSAFSSSGPIWFSHLENQAEVAAKLGIYRH